MGRNSVFVAIAFLAGLVVGFFGRSAHVLAMPQNDTRAADLAAIEKLHQEDIQVTLSQDEKGLIDIWTDDAVRLMPGSPPDVGKQAIRAENQKFHAKTPGFNMKLSSRHIAWLALVTSNPKPPSIRLSLLWSNDKPSTTSNLLVFLWTLKFT